ncbi:hypothetical protein RFI_25940 [Reticulomyxa filosa]|uniref:Uncharacterized protein n=1 Tax=Reticulomyxa filosa TaxID=46433 RepID=X6MCR7_RETFI|nr:hypothetical protein RFI_25940 [Reticulomyxa filosa]|eukprot:ETO11436.1 hypothetical protein RFI_25940 [Reticulomyxa filosa]
MNTLHLKSGQIFCQISAQWLEDHILHEFNEIDQVVDSLEKCLTAEIPKDVRNVIVDYAFDSTIQKLHNANVTLLCLQKKQVPQDTSEITETVMKCLYGADCEAKNLSNVACMVEDGEPLTFEIHYPTSAFGGMLQGQLALPLTCNFNLRFGSGHLLTPKQEYFVFDICTNTLNFRDPTVSTNDTNKTIA